MQAAAITRTHFHWMTACRAGTPEIFAESALHRNMPSVVGAMLPLFNRGGDRTSRFIRNTEEFTNIHIHIPMFAVCSFEWISRFNEAPKVTKYRGGY